MAKSSKLTPSQQQVRAFFILLDAKAKQFHFRTFVDKQGITRRDLVGKISGNIKECEQELRQRNACEAGIFVVINEGGHKDEVITRVRAVFADTDGAPLEPIVQALEPHCVICTSPGKWHVYWLVDEDFPLDQFKPVQRAIAEKFETDRSVNNLSRVMRLPGFLHNKKEPFEVQFHSLNRKLPRYSADQIIAGLSLNLNAKQAAAPAASAPTARSLRLWDALYINAYGLIDVEKMLCFIDPWSSRDRWLKVIFILATEYGEAGRDLAVRWSRGDLWKGSNS